MKNLIELMDERAQTIDAMSAIINAAKNETRELSTDERGVWDQRNEKIKDLDKQIEILQRQEELNKRAAKNAIDSPEKKLAKRYDLFRAIRNITGTLDGAEAEVQAEGVAEMKRCGIGLMDNAVYIPSSMIGMNNKRVYSEIGTGDSTPPIKTGAVDLLSVVRTPLIMDTLGVTSYTGLTGNLKVPKMGQLTATFVSEKSAVTTGGASLVSDTLAPRRVGSGDRFTKELFAQTSPQIQNQILTEFVDAIYRAVQTDLMDAVAAGGTIPGTLEIGDTVAALTHANLLLLEATIETGYEGMAWACSPAQRAKLKALKLDSGSGVFAWAYDNTILGYNAYATASLSATNGGSSNTAFDLIFGYWKAAVYGQWGGIELIVDPYTYADYGEYKVTANGLFDTGVANSLHFAVCRNADA